MSHQVVRSIAKRTTAESAFQPLAVVPRGMCRIDMTFHVLGLGLAYFATINWAENGTEMSAEMSTEFGTKSASLVTQYINPTVSSRSRRLTSVWIDDRKPCVVPYRNLQHGRKVCHPLFSNMCSGAAVGARHTWSYSLSPYLMTCFHCHPSYRCRRCQGFPGSGHAEKERKFRLPGGFRWGTSQLPRNLETNVPSQGRRKRP